MAVAKPEELKSLAVGEALTDSIPGKGNGAIQFIRKPSGRILAFYRYSVGGARKRISIGSYREKQRDLGYTLNEIREKAFDLARLRQQHGDLSVYFEKAKEQQKNNEIEAKKIKDALAARGTMSDLLQDYMSERSSKSKPSSIKEMRRLHNLMLESHPHILNLHAAEVETWHIKEIIIPIHARNAKIMAERYRRFISAAFNYGAKSENIIGRSSAKIYEIKANPAATITVDRIERKITRALSEPELKQLWHTLDLANRVGPVISMLLKFVIATGGQRISNIIESEWKSYDLENKVLHLHHSKGKGGHFFKRDHPVPLTPRALEILNFVHRLNGNKARPWTTVSDGRPIALSSIKNAINRWLTSDHSFLDGNKITPFTARDLRRTCTQLMAKYGVNDRQSDEIQAHGIGGIVEDHYRNNPIVTLPRRIKTMQQWEEILTKILDNKTQ
ncbi:tyrosine-type recombinase/integrase [Pseudomonas jilinensis]|uniref:Integrase n=1 Tax=Pseudomonas jilinensis TaxID=2078689 RepID=A0A396S6Q7_9PSED|nr:tyrosine-type recombinase/integrase [Pseudomonas jilinensis]RHW22373.1 integrase [Pseudomonas jilinensis]